jgi:hypothetical protein
VTSIAKALAAAALLAALLVVSPVRPAAAATPCWKTLLNDWYDGRIDNVYPVHCYQDTLKHLPEDVSVYSSARDDILRALQSARAKLKASHKPAGANALVPAQTTGNNDTTSTTTTPATTKGGKGPGGTDAGGGKNGSPGRQPGKGLPGVAQQLNPSSPSSLPVPLLVLGGLALLLVAAGAAGLIVKRLQSRRPGT